MSIKPGLPTVDQRSLTITPWLGKGSKPEDIATKVNNLLRPFLPLVERPLRKITGSALENGCPPQVESVDEADLGIQNYTSLFVNPKILLHKPAILLGEETICEADETVWRSHSLVGRT